MHRLRALELLWRAGAPEKMVRELVLGQSEPSPCLYLLLFLRAMFQRTMGSSWFMPLHFFIIGTGQVQRKTSFQNASRIQINHRIHLSLPVRLQIRVASTAAGCAYNLGVQDGAEPLPHLHPKHSDTGHFGPEQTTSSNSFHNPQVFWQGAVAPEPPRQTPQTNLQSTWAATTSHFGTDGILPKETTNDTPFEAVQRPPGLADQVPVTHNSNLASPITTSLLPPGFGHPVTAFTTNSAVDAPAFPKFGSTDGHGAAPGSSSSTLAANFPTKLLRHQLIAQSKAQQQMQKSLQGMLGIVQQAVSVAQEAAMRAEEAERAASVKAPSQVADEAHNDEHVKSEGAGAPKLSSLT